MNQPKAQVKLELLVQRKVHFFKRTLKIFFSIIICKMAGKLLPRRTFTDATSVFQYLRRLATRALCSNS